MPTITERILRLNNLQDGTGNIKVDVSYRVHFSAFEPSVMTLNRRFRLI